MAIFLFIVRLGQMLEAVEMSWEGQRGVSHDVPPEEWGDDALHLHLDFQ